MQPRPEGGAKRAGLQGQVHDVSITCPLTLTCFPSRLTTVIINLGPGSKNAAQAGGRRQEGGTAGTGP